MTRKKRKKKEIPGKYVERSQNGQETWRTRLSQGARTESGEVRTGMGGDVCSSHFLQPAHPSLTCKQRMGHEGGPSYSRANRKRNHGSLCLDSVYRKSRSSKLIQGEIKKGKALSKILRIVTTLFMISLRLTLDPVVSKPRHTGQQENEVECSHASHFTAERREAQEGVFHLPKATKSEVAQPCLTLWDPIDRSPPGSSTHGIFQARILEWVAISFSRRSSDLGIKPGSPSLQTDALPSEPPGKPLRPHKDRTIFTTQNVCA